MAKRIRYTLTPYAGNKADYGNGLGEYDTIVDFFGGSLGGTLKTAIDNPNASYYVAEASNCQRALIEFFLNEHFYDLYSVCNVAKDLIDDFFNFDNYQTATYWLTDQYNNALLETTYAALSVMRRFFFSSILRTTPGSGDINVWISVRKILGDAKWKKLVAEYYPGVDYNTLDTQQTKQFNAEFAQKVFSNGILHLAMADSVNAWYEMTKPVFDEWQSQGRSATVVDNYKALLDNGIIQGKTLLYIDPPYYNSNKGKFRDESGRLRSHKQTPSYENHDPASEDTWKMFSDCLEFGLRNGCDMVLCNYTSDRFIKAVEAIKGQYDLIEVVAGKTCNCTGQKSKYTSLPIGQEYVLFATPKVESQELAA